MRDPGLFEGQKFSSKSNSFVNRVGSRCYRNLLFLVLLLTQHSLPCAALTDLMDTSEENIVDALPLSPAESNLTDSDVAGVRKEEIAPSTKKGKRVLGKPKKEKFGAFNHWAPTYSY